MTSPDVSVSVVIPVRDGAEYLAIALDSLRHQTFVEFEVIVVDDGSTDASPRIVEEFAAIDNRFRLERSEGAGIVAALNLGCSIARAPLVARLDADDIAYPHRLESQRQAFAGSSGLVLVASAADVVDAAGTPIARRVVKGDVRRSLTDGNPIVHSTVMFSRAAFVAVGGYREAFRHAEDYDLWLRLAKQGDVLYLPEPLTAYRTHAAQVSAARVREQAHAALAAQSEALSMTPATPAEVDEKVAASLVQLVAFAVDAGDLEHAERLLREAGAIPVGGGTRAALGLQEARIHWRRGKWWRALWVLLHALACSPRRTATAFPGMSLTLPRNRR